jgi:hypothetical protein
MLAMHEKQAKSFFIHLHNHCQQLAATQNDIVVGPTQRIDSAPKYHFVLLLAADSDCEDE